MSRTKIFENMESLYKCWKWPLHSLLYYCKKGTFFPAKKRAFIVVPFQLKYQRNFQKHLTYTRFYQETMVNPMYFVLMSSRFDITSGIYSTLLYSQLNKKSPTLNP
jgi:hypothetical protein